MRMRVLTNESVDVTKPPSHRAVPPLTEQPVIRRAERKNMMFRERKRFVRIHPSTRGSGHFLFSLKIVQCNHDRVCFLGRM